MLDIFLKGLKIKFCHYRQECTLSAHESKVHKELVLELLDCSLQISLIANLQKKGQSICFWIILDKHITNFKFLKVIVIFGSLAFFDDIENDKFFFGIGWINYVHNEF